MCTKYKIAIELTFMFICFLQPVVNRAQWIQTNGPFGGKVQNMTSNSTNTFACIYLDGLYSSTDNGENWNKTNLNEHLVYSVAASNTNVYVGTQGHGVFYSSDNGNSWSQAGLNNLWVTSIAVNGNNIFAGIFYEGIFLSTNNGQNWTQTSLNMYYIHCIAIDGNNIFAGADGFLYLSTNNGLNWNLLPLNNQVSINSIAIHGSNIFVATDLFGISSSTDYGQSWTQTPLTNQDIKAIVVEENNVFAGNYNGVYLSTNNGLNWSLTTLTNQYVLSLLVKGNTIFAGGVVNGVFISTNNGQNWYWKSNGLKGQHIFSFTKGKYNSGNYDIFSGCGEVFKSSDNGNTWNNTTWYNTSYSSAYSMAIKNNNIFVGSNLTIYFSSDYGMNWSLTNYNSSNYNVISLAISNNNMIFAGPDWGHLARSSDNGQTWVSTFTDFYFVPSILINSNYIFIGTGLGVWFSTNNGDNWTQTSLNNQFINALTYNGTNLFAGSDTNGVFKSTDNGATWVQTSLNDMNVVSLESSGQNIFAGTDSNGVFLSTNNGQNWYQKNEGLNNTYIQSLLIANGCIFAGTNGSSVYRRSIDEIIGIGNINSKIPDKYYLYQNYPNPFNPTTKIKYQIPRNSFVKLTIYDVLGREISILVNEKQNAGIYELNLDARTYPSGIYFYRLNTETFNETKRMILIK